jgi:hypothetical protein
VAEVLGPSVVRLPSAEAGALARTLGADETINYLDRGLSPIRDSINI